jgi:hypothetical protein
VAGDEGFEPPILGPEPSALPLGQSPSTGSIVANSHTGCQIKVVFRSIAVIHVISVSYIGITT